MQGLLPDPTLPQAIRGEAEEGLQGPKTPPDRLLNPFPPKSFPEASRRAAGAQRMGGPGSPRLFTATFLPPPSLCPPPLFQAVAPPLLRVMSAPPRPPQEHCGQIWRTQQCLGAGTDWGGGAAAPGWDRWQLVRGRGAQGAAARTSQGDSGTPRPSRWLTGTGEAHFLGTLLGVQAPTQGPTGDPYPTRPGTGAHGCRCAAWLPALTCK